MDYRGVREKDVEEYTEQLQNTAFNFSMIQEQSLYEITRLFVLQVEKWEKEALKDKYRSNLFEVNRLASEKLAKEKEKQIKLERERLELLKIEEEEEVRNRVNFMMGDKDAMLTLKKGSSMILGLKK